MNRDQWLGTCLQALVFVPCLIGAILSLAARGRDWSLAAMIGCYLIAGAAFVASLVFELRARRTKKPPPGTPE
ncbi:hypothetical protein Csp2054_04075 [Curtobacterium sp. 'Ferrero']|nr:hypothetical protein Csp2054_04075 [Curtobacterium sp. 'Ferrero']